ncbi:MAG: hypothetical protein RPS47_07940 [Colwellia sp.]
MILLLSGEGSSDMGLCTNSVGSCTAANYRPGAMAFIVDKLVNLYQNFELSYLDANLVEFVSEKYLADNKPEARAKSFSMPGKKKAKETQYFFANARALAIEAKRLAREKNDKVLAVLFRDSDGTASSGRGEWGNKRQSMKDGFAAEGYDLAVAMMPKPKSEAWLICALKENPYQACESLENRSGNDKSENSLKTEFNALVQAHDSGLAINELIVENHIDVNRIDMDSMNDFKADLKAAVEKVFPQGNG